MSCCSDFLSQLKPTLFDDRPASNAIPNKLNDKYASFYFGDVIKSKFLSKFNDWCFVVLKRCFLKGNQAI